METKKEFHFEQPQVEKSLTQWEKHIKETYGENTERQLLEEQTHLLQLAVNNLRSISNNVQFFFWLTIIGMGIIFLVFIYEK